MGRESNSTKPKWIEEMRNNEIDFKEIARFALMHARTLVLDIAPGGTLQGREYVCATVNGGQGNSCKINIDTGLWADWPRPDNGGNLKESFPRWLVSNTNQYPERIRKTLYENKKYRHFKEEASRTTSS
jgi:hypothetical protein